MEFPGLGLNLGNLSRLSSAKSRSISPENFTGEKGKGGMSTDGPAANMARGLGQASGVGEPFHRGGLGRGVDGGTRLSRWSVFRSRKGRKSAARDVLCGAG